MIECIFRIKKFLVEYILEIIYLIFMWFYFKWILIYKEYINSKD